MDLPIKLGQKPEMPSSTGSMPEHEMDEYFPTLHLEWDKPYNLPDDEFTMTVKARKVRSAEDKKNERISEDIEILEITSVKAYKQNKNSPREEAGAAIDKLKDEGNY